MEFLEPSAHDVPRQALGDGDTLVLPGEAEVQLLVYHVLCFGGGGVRARNGHTARRSVRRVCVHIELDAAVPLDLLQIARTVFASIVVG